MKFLLVFLSATVADAVWAYYIRRTSTGKAIEAGLSAVVLMVAGGVTTILYMADRRLLFGAALGAFVGTYLVVWWDHHKNN